MEKYLKRCLDSVVNQTYKDFEAIIVNDGSTDGSAEIIEEYLTLDSRFRLINQENQGPSAARNSALEVISGEKFTLLDADDWFDKDFLEKLASAPDSDYVLGCYRKIYPDGEEVEYLSESEKRQNFHDFLCNSLARGIVRCPWGKLYSSKIVREHNLRNNTKLRMGEDTDFNLRYLVYAQSFSTCDACYNYVKERRNSRYRKSCSDICVHLDIFRESYNMLCQAKSCRCKKLEGVIRRFYISRAFLFDCDHNAFSFRDFNDFMHMMWKKDFQRSAEPDGCLNKVLNTIIHLPRFFHNRFIYPVYKKLSKDL